MSLERVSVAGGHVSGARGVEGLASGRIIHPIWRFRAVRFTQLIMCDLDAPVFGEAVALLMHIVHHAHPMHGFL